MSAPAVISGDFATFRHVQGRKCLQLVIEVPAEAAASVFSTLGYPGSGNPIPVAVARLVEQPAAAAAPAPAERKSWDSLPYAQQAAIRCREPDFHRFCAERAENLWSSLIRRTGGEAEAAADLVRAWCGVASRSDIIKGKRSGENWEAVEGDYYAWQRGIR